MFVEDIAVKCINSAVKRELRKNLCDKYGGLCAYCGKLLGMKGMVDHYLPYALGGTNEYENLRWCCLSCNHLKGDMQPEAWEKAKPPYRPPETKHDKRVRLLAQLAQRKGSVNDQSRIEVDAQDAPSL